MYFNQDFSLGKLVKHSEQPQFFNHHACNDPVLSGNKVVNCGDGIDYFYAKHSFAGDELADIALINTNNQASTDPKFHSCQNEHELIMYVKKNYPQPNFCGMMMSKSFFVPN